MFRAKSGAESRRSFAPAEHEVAQQRAGKKVRRKFKRDWRPRNGWNVLSRAGAKREIVRRNADGRY
jgi:hypothetical protein